MGYIYIYTDDKPPTKWAIYGLCGNCMGYIWIKNIFLSGLYMDSMGCMGYIWIINHLSGLYMDSMGYMGYIWIINHLSG